MILKLGNKGRRGSFFRVANSLTTSWGGVSQSNIIDRFLSNLNNLSKILITKIVLDVDNEDVSNFESFILILFEVPNVRINLEYLEICSTYEFHDFFIKNWSEYIPFQNIKQVQFTNDDLVKSDYKHLKNKMLEYFKEVNIERKSMVCSYII